MMSFGAANPCLFGFSALDERSVFIAGLARAGKNLSASEVRQLRRALFEEAALSRDEARALFELDRAQKGARSPEWTEYFVRSLTDHVVWQSRPAGIVDAEQAEWLLEEADAAGTAAALALLANVLAEAHRAPQWFIEAVRARAAAPAIKAALAAAAQGAKAAAAAV